MEALQFYERIELNDRSQAVKKKLDKKMFYDYGDVNKKEKNVITKFVERMELTYLLTPSTINIQAFINEEYHYEGVMFVTVQLRDDVTDKRVRLLEEVIHGALPNPIVITFAFKDQICVSSCMKRLNRVNKNNVVLETIHRTNWFSESNSISVVDNFMQSMLLSNLSFTTFFDFYKDIDLAVKAYQDSEIIGAYKVLRDDKERQQQETIISQINDIEQEINTLKAAIKKESQFNKKVELNMKVQQLKKELDNIKRNAK
ncbi:DUF4391 domain-containing protein [Gracilibacillus dipsosauri]|uniref:DUF4391 domain-containing protein n=1 Tax=Gracilibacillus dipsosauri TaxID=178340 RepID=UPI00240A4329